MIKPTFPALEGGFLSSVPLLPSSSSLTERLTEDFRLALQNNHLVKVWKPSSFMGQRWGEVKKQSKMIISVNFIHSIVSNSVIPWIAAHQASLSITNSRSLHKLMFIESVMPSNHLILCLPLLLQPSIFHNIRVFSNVSSSH